MSQPNYWPHYKPSVAASGIFTAISAILTIAHCYFIVRTKRYFPITIVIGGLFLAIGHIARAYARSHMDQKAPVAIQAVLIILAPVWFAAGIYMFLGRLIIASGFPKLSIIRPRWVTAIFVIGDILCFLVQGLGASQLVNAERPNDFKKAENIILGGLVLQIVIFGFFLVVGVTFNLRWKKVQKSRGIIQQLLWTLYICSILVLIRSFFRLIEYKQGQGGYLLSNEWPVYVFDVSLMVILMGIALSWYRGSLEPPSYMGPSATEVLPLR